MTPMRILGKIGLIGIILILFTTCDALDVGLGGKVDIDAPEIAITSHFNGDYVRGVAEVIGTAADDLELKSVNVILGEFLYPAELFDDGTWLVAIDTNEYTDGEQDLTVQAYDGTDKVTETNILLIFDNTSPTVVMTLPQSYGAGQEFNTRISIKGESADATRVKTVEVLVYSDTGVLVEQGAATGTTSWSYVLDSTAYADGPYYFFIKATDYSGNNNAYFYHLTDVNAAAASVSDVPTIEQIDEMDRVGGVSVAAYDPNSLPGIRKTTDSGKRVSITVNQASDVPQFSLSNPDENSTASENVFGAQQRFLGLISDDDGVDPDTIAIKIVNTGTAAVVQDWLTLGAANVTGSGLSVRWDYTESLVDGDYSIEVSAEDIYGVSGASNPVQFIVNSQAPTVLISSPSQGSYISNNSRVTVGGTFQGYGNKTLDVSLDSGTTWTAVTSSGAANAPFSYDIIGSVHADTNYTVTNSEITAKFRVGDGLGVYGYTNLLFVGDVTPPTIEVLNPDASLPVNGSLTISGVSTDNTVIDVVEMNLKKIVDPDNWVTATGTYNWELIVDTHVYGHADYATLEAGETSVWNWTVPIRVTDVAGNQQTLNLALQISQDTNKPVIQLNNLNIAGTAAQNLLETNPKVIGTVSDDKKVERDSIQISIDGGVWIPVSGLPAVDQQIVSWSHDLSALLDGIHQFSIRAYDLEFASMPGVDTAAATYPAYPDQAFSNWSLIGPVAFAVDRSSPTFTIDTPAAGAYKSSTFLITGTTSDENEVTAVDVSVMGGAFAAATDTSGAAKAFSTWQYSFPVGAGAGEYATGTYTFQVRTTDQFGKTALLDRQVIVDTQIPTSIIDLPYAGSNANGSLTVSGSASDNNPLSALYIWVGLTAATPPADVATWATPTGTNVWTYNLDTTGLADGAYTVHVVPVDVAGNEGTDVTRAFVIQQDSDRPVISLSNLTIGGSLADNGLGRDASILGIIEDDDSVDSTSIEVSIDGGAWAAISDPPAADGKVVSWTHALIGVLQGAHTATIRARDTLSGGSFAAGDYNWQSVGPVNFMVDYGPPDLAITSPANASIHNSTFTIVGTSYDPNGMQTVDISVNGGAYQTVTTANTFADWTYTFTVAADGSTDGSHSYQMLASDSSGATTTLDRQVVVDATQPTISYDYPADNATVNGSSVEIRGRSNDNRVVSSVYIYVGTPPSADPLTWTLLAGTYNWSHTFDSTSGAYPDAAYTVHVKAIDEAGNVSIDYTRTIQIDQSTDRPVITLSNMDPVGTALDNGVGLDASLIGTVEDDDSVDRTTIEVNVDSAGWTAISSPPAANGLIVSWSHDLSGVGEGAHQVNIRARDINSSGSFAAGDFNWQQLGPVLFSIDYGPPSLTVVTPTTTDFYRNATFNITGTSSDTNGLAVVEISFNGSTWTTVDTADAFANWSYTYPVVGGTPEGTKVFWVRSTDNAGSSRTLERQAVVDYTVPIIELLQPADGDTVNGSISLKGTASDDRSVDTMTTKVGTEPPVAAANPYSFNRTIDTTDYVTYGHTDNSNLTVTVTVTDVAGNVTVGNYTLAVNQSADKPIITANSVTLAGPNALGRDPAILFTVEDDDGVDVDLIQSSMDSGTTWSNLNPVIVSSDTVLTQAKTTLTGIAQGTHTIRFRAMDIGAGANWAIYGDAANMHWSETADYPLTVDYGPPVVNLTGPAASTVFKDDFVVSGSAVDYNGATHIEIEMQGATYTKTYISGTDFAITPTADITPVPFSFTIPIDTDVNYVDGDYNLQIRATDGSGTIGTLDRPTAVDQTPPSVAFQTSVNEHLSPKLNALKKPLASSNN